MTIGASVKSVNAPHANWIKTKIESAFAQRLTETFPFACALNQPARNIRKTPTVTDKIG